MSAGAVTLISVLSSFLSFMAGLWGATYLQDREIRRRHLGIIRALLAEIGRISTEVGASNPTYITVSIFGASPAVPQLAPWVQGAATDLASTNATFLSMFMDLDRFLINLRTADKQQEAVLNALESQREGVKVLAKNKDIVGQVVAEAELKRVEETAKRAEFNVEVDFKNAKRTLTELRKHLQADEELLAAGLRTHLPW